MTLRSLVEEASRQPFVTEDGDPSPLELCPPVTNAALEDLESRIPSPVPDDVRDLLSLCSGFTGGAVDFVDFTGKECQFEDSVIFPHGLPIAADGYGNFWVVDLLPDSLYWGPVYFACHDAPVILFQSASLEEFLRELFKLSVPPHRSLVDDVHEDRLFEVWRRNPGVRAQEECLEAEDPVLVEFAKQLDESFQIVDMREVEVGFGFSWGRYGPKTIVKRHGSTRIFGYSRPLGLLNRLVRRFA